MKIEGIDRIYCINLEKRPDRRKEAIDEFSKLNLEFDFFNGVDGHALNVQSRIKPGHVGCVLSHLNLYKELLRTAGDVFMITEDDVVFADNFIEEYYKKVKEVPSDWKLLYFGGNHNGVPLVMVSDNVHRLQKTYTTHCYLIKKEILRDVIDQFEGPDIFTKEVDVHLAGMQKIFPSYGFTPPLAWQRDGFSDIEMKNVEYNFLKK
jgi:GR25 family glycosyltransferase involved in LPS biosynthesis